MKKAIVKEFVEMNTIKTNKSDMLKTLQSVPANTKELDENLLSRVKYTLDTAKKDLRKVTKEDLSDLIKEIASIFTVPAKATVEADKKPLKKSSAKSDEDTEKPAPKKSLKKKGVQTSTPRTAASKELPCASMFPEEVSVETAEGDMTLVAAHDKYHSIDDVRKALEDGKTLFIAAYWSKRHIKEYNYADTFVLPEGNVPKEFDNDLDILNIVVACDTLPRVFAMSLSTEAMVRFESEDFAPVEDKDPATGDKFTVRVSNGMEFEVYEAQE